MLADHLVFVFNEEAARGAANRRIPLRWRSRWSGRSAASKRIYVAALVGVGVVWLLVRQCNADGLAATRRLDRRLGYLVWQMARMEQGRAPAADAGAGADRGLDRVLPPLRAEPARPSTSSPSATGAAQQQLLDAAPRADAVVQSMAHICWATPLFAWMWSGAEPGAGATPARSSSSAWRSFRSVSAFRASVGAEYANAAFRVPVNLPGHRLPVPHHRRALPASPVGLSKLTKLAPARMISTLMAVWFLAASAAQWQTGKIAPAHGGRDRRRPGARPARAQTCVPHLPDHQSLGRRRGRRAGDPQPVARRADRTA